MIKKLGAGRNGSKINTAREQIATFLEICSALAKSTGASDVLYEEADCFYNKNLA